MKYLLAFSLAAAGIAAPAMAQIRGSADANRNGVVTRTEAAAAADRRFAALDANHDGTVTPIERRAARQQRRARVVGAAEFQARAQARFARLDANHDGSLTGDERRAGRRHAGGRRYDMREGTDRMAAAQSMTGAQFHDRALARFDRIDTNRDGRIDQAERAAARRAPHDASPTTEG